MKIVDAAHILPVAAGNESIDNIRNGIAPSPTYHRAFDNGLIYLTEDYEMHLNTDRANELTQLSLSGGITALEATLGTIHLPQDPSQRPDISYIQLANQYRGIS
jgi:putative restriction endonuclease